MERGPIGHVNDCILSQTKRRLRQNQPLDVAILKDRDPDPIEVLLRARLRISKGADLRIKALLTFLEGIDGLCRLTTGRAFFAIRESRRMLMTLDG